MQTVDDEIVHSDPGKHLFYRYGVEDLQEFTSWERPLA